MNKTVSIETAEWFARFFSWVQFTAPLTFGVVHFAPKGKTEIDNAYRKSCNQSDGSASKGSQAPLQCRPKLLILVVEYAPIH